MQKSLRRSSFVLLITIPLTAIFHHLIFYPPTCILNLFGPDYYFDVVRLWLQNDPSFPIAFVLALIAWLIARRFVQIRSWSVAFILAFLPLSVWIWDIPFTGRLICHALHDGKSFIHTRHLYMIGAAAWLSLVFFFRRKVS